MKETIKATLFFLLLGFTLTVVSCNNEELFVEPVTEVEEEETPVEEEEEIDTPDDTTTSADPSLPCEFSLNDIEPNSTVVIDCVMDLGGATVNLPANVTILYEGGEIINGTLNFSEGSVIDGDLLNVALTITGSTPQLKDPAFNFVPERWEIVQGETTSEIALRNRDILESIMNEIKELGITEFIIDEIDAYFEVSKVTSGTSNQNFYPWVEAINVPSDFNLIMTDNTNLRVFPNSRDRYSLMSVYDAKNVTITGGNLIGDRDEHDYSSGGSHEWGHVMELKAAVNTTVSNVRMMYGAGDGVKISSLNFTYDVDYRPSNNVIVRDCTFDSNRRNNISITGGMNITIENNLLLNAGVDTQKSLGTNPRYGLDVESTRNSDGNGGYVYLERAENILIRNNTERGSARGGLTVHIGFNVTIDSNITENSIGYSYTEGTKIINNVITSTPSSYSTTGIDGGKSSSKSTRNNEISGNTVTGFNVGINVKNTETQVFNNTILNNVVGIVPISLTNSDIYNNTIDSDVDSSKGMAINITELNNVTIEGNSITAVQNSIKINRCNTASESINNTVLIKNNEFYGPRYSQIIDSHGLVFENNKFNHGIELYDSNDITFNNNEITTPNHDGIYLRRVNTDISISNNAIDVASNKTCIRIDSTTNSSEIADSNNNCF
ncbi:right-handed parallel beta-helix repeat-containing protein [Seonamhaeicola sp.]|uniref:right-handed parallel beta-helix repeat-containing protein n=1 Tax=Seonamhaeicola sp. TaxID=1912245 RepID=UPI00262CDC12|nr:right-handed parallel beta-helix repeat-containing protein [Seonamhaeicola sp.]